MKPFAWSPEINAQLIVERQLCFEAVVIAIEGGDLLDVLEHPNPQRDPGQRILIVRLEGSVHLVPVVETDEHFFLKTIIPSRKAHRQYTSEKNRPNRAMKTIPATLRLDAEEHQLLNDFEAGALRSTSSPELLQALSESAKATGLKDQRINIRISRGDLQALRTRALQEGIPYQTLISSVLHKYVSGTL